MRNHGEAFRLQARNHLIKTTMSFYPGNLATQDDLADLVSQTELTDALAAKRDLVEPFVAMEAEEIDVSIPGNSYAVSGNAVLTFSDDTPDDGTQTALLLQGGTADSVLTIPEAYSDKRGTITSITVPAAATVLVLFKYIDSQWLLLGDPQSYQKQSIGIACSDETTPLEMATGGSTLVTFEMPFTMINVTVRASLTTAQTGGNAVTVDIFEDTHSILSTPITIDNDEKSSATAAAAPVVSDGTLAEGAELAIELIDIGNGTAAGLKIWLEGDRLV